MHWLNVLRVTLREPKRYAPTFEFFEGRPDANGDRFYMHERSSNGQISGTGGEGFATRYNAKRAAYAKAARVEGAKVVDLDELNRSR